MSKKLRNGMAPVLVIPKGIVDLSFYSKALGAVEIRRWSNDDGSIHVAELAIDGALFHLHEEMPGKQSLSPLTSGSITCSIGLFVDDVDAVMLAAIAAGAKERNPAQDYDY